MTIIKQIYKIFVANSHQTINEVYKYNQYYGTLSLLNRKEHINTLVIFERITFIEDQNWAILLNTTTRSYQWESPELASP